MNYSRVAPSARKTLCMAMAAAGFCALAQASDLTSMSLEQLMDLKVVGASKYEQRQSEVAAAVSVITRDEIRTFGWRTLDEALASLPGVHVTYDRQYVYLGMRGFGLPGDYNTRVLVTINGNRANDPTYDGGPMGRMLPVDLALVDRIEFIPGPASAVYGQNAMFGVVNLVTREGGDVDGFEVGARSQHPQREAEGRATWGRKLDNGINVLLSATRLTAHGENRFYDYGAAGTSGIATNLDGASDKDFFARVSGSRWSVDLLRGDYRKDDPTGTYLSDPLVPGQYQRDRYTMVQAQYEDRFADDTLSVLARAFAGEERYDSELSYGTRYRFPAEGRWRGAEMRFLYTGFSAHKLMLGVETHDNARIEQRIENQADPSQNLVIRSPGSRNGLYLQDDWRIVDKLSATLGVRVDRHDSMQTTTSPRAALIWQAAPSTTVKALYGRAHRAPNAFERDYTDNLSQVGNPGLEGEVIDTAECVVDHRASSQLNLRASLYQWNLEHLITLGIDPVSGLPQYQSGAPVRAKGLNLSAEQAWASGVRLRGNVSFQRVRQDSGEPLINSPKALARLHLSTPLPAAGLRMGYALQYDAGRRTLNGTELGGFAVSNVYLSTETLAPGLELGIGVWNLFDKRYAHPAADTNWQNSLEQDGRSVRFDLRYRWR